MAWIEIPITSWATVYSQGNPYMYRPGELMGLGYHTCIVMGITIPTHFLQYFPNVRISLKPELNWSDWWAVIYYSQNGTYNPGGIRTNGTQLCFFTLPSNTGVWTTLTAENINSGKPLLGAGFIYLVLDPASTYYSDYIKAGNIRFWVDYEDAPAVYYKNGGVYSGGKMYYRTGGIYKPVTPYYRTGGVYRTKGNG